MNFPANVLSKIGEGRKCHFLLTYQAVFGRYDTASNKKKYEINSNYLIINVINFIWVLPVICAFSHTVDKSLQM